MVTRITWRSSSMGGTNGFVGQLLLFHIGYGLTQPQDGFVLSGELPMPTLKGFKSEEQAKERAERRLRNFVTHLGASFPPEPPEAQEKAPVTGENHSDGFEAWWTAWTKSRAMTGLPVGQDSAKALARQAYDTGFASALSKEEDDE